MKFDKIKIYFLEFTLLIVLSFALFVLNKNSRIILAVLLVIYSIITFFTIKKKSLKHVDSKKVVILLIIFAIIYLIAFYVMGLYFGYYESVYKFSYWTILNYIIPIIVIIISSEFVRNRLLAQNTKNTGLIVILITVLIDMIIYSNIYNITTYQGLTEIVGFIFFASVACNLLYNYISFRYGILGNILYRLITILYVYIFPIIPDVYVFFRSILRIIYPYIIYQVLEYTFVEDKRVIGLDDRKKNIAYKIMVIVMVILLAMLISCQFTYGILVIGSESMTGTVNKGDSIIYKKYDENNSIELEDIVVINKDDIQVVHRVIEVKNVNGEIRYTTKGDANQDSDDGYITQNDIVGIYKFKIAYIGYPSLWLRDIFSK